MRQIIKELGGFRKAAEALNIPRTSLHRWVKSKSIPPHRVLAVERITGVPRHELRPDIYPPPNANQEVRG